MTKQLFVLLVLVCSASAQAKGCGQQLTLLEQAIRGFDSTEALDAWVNAISSVSACGVEDEEAAEAQLRRQLLWDSLYDQHEYIRSPQACGITAGLLSVSDGLYSQALIENVYDAYVAGRIDKHCDKQYVAMPVMRAAVNKGIEVYGCDGMLELIRARHDEACLH